MRAELIRFITFISGLYFLAEYLLPPLSFFKDHHQQVLTGVQVVGIMAFGLGIYNIFRVHGGKIIKAQRGSLNSLALLLGFFLMFAAQFADFWAQERLVRQWSRIRGANEYQQLWLKGEKKDLSLVQQTLLGVSADLSSKVEQYPDKPKIKTLSAEYQRQLKLSLLSYEKLAAISPTSKEELVASSAELSSELKALTKAARDLSEALGAERLSGRLGTFLFDGLFVSLGSSMFALLAFYITLAAYRSFRLRSVEAGVMMAAAVVVILGQIPFGEMYISEKLPAFRQWLMENVNTAGNRAIFFGSAIAGLAMALRLWLSLDKNAKEGGV